VAFRGRKPVGKAGARGCDARLCVRVTHQSASTKADCHASSHSVLPPEQGQESQQEKRAREDAAHDWVRHTVLEQQPFHAATSPNFSRAR